MVADRLMLGAAEHQLLFCQVSGQMRIFRHEQGSRLFIGLSIGGADQDQIGVVTHIMG